MKLAELHKESSEEWSKKAGELEGVIKALEVTNLLIYNSCIFCPSSEVNNSLNFSYKLDASDPS